MKKPENLKIIYRKTNDLIPYVNNARTHSDEQVTQIASSIKEFGFNNPILTDGENGVIAGHGRLLAAKKLGLETVPTIELSGLTEAQKKAYILADNKIALNSGWDEELLKIELDDLKLQGVNLETVGFSDEELSELIISNDEDQNKEEDELSDPKLEPISQEGDIWILGEHKLLCGDSTREDDFALLMQDERADLVFTDPPYNVAIGDKYKAINNVCHTQSITDNLIGDTFKSDEECGEKLWLPAFTNLKKFSKDCCSCYVTMPQGGTHMMMMMMMMNGGWQVKHELIWVKNQAVFSMNRLDYDYQHEPILYGWNKKHTYYGGGKFKTSLWYFDKPRSSKLHPTMKPVELVEEAILNSSKKGDLVMDAFGGSGTTVIACENKGRKARVIEKDPKYADVIVTRWQNHTGQKAVRYQDGKEFDELCQEQKLKST